MKKSPIMRERTIGVAHFMGSQDSPVAHIVDYKTGTMKRIDATTEGGGATAVGWAALPANERPVYVRKVTCLMSSAILAKSGSETGEMWATPTRIASASTSHRLRSPLFPIQAHGLPKHRVHQR
jgi:hypothetical protein